MNILKNKLNCRLFHLNERAISIYTKNIMLQNKLDEINLKGTGNYVPKSVRANGPRKPGHSEIKGSLHWSFKKREA